MNVAEFTKIVLDTVDRPPVYPNPFLPDATMTTTYDDLDDLDQRFTKEMELLVQFVNLEPSFFETLRRATELFQLINQKMTHAYSTHPQKWYRLAILIHGKVHEFLDTLTEATHIPLLGNGNGNGKEEEEDTNINKHKNIVTNFIQCLLNTASVVEPILMRNNYFDEMQVDEEEEEEFI